MEFFCEGKLWIVSFLGVASYIHPQGSPFRYSQDFETKLFLVACRISTFALVFSSLSSDPSPPFPPSLLLSSSSEEEEEDKEEKEEEHARNTNPSFLFLDDNSRATFRNNMTTKGLLWRGFRWFFCPSLQKKVVKF